MEGLHRGQGTLHSLNRANGSHRYSVPAKFIGKRMYVKLTEEKVQIYDGETGMFLAAHERCHSAVGMKTHLPTRTSDT